MITYLTFIILLINIHKIQARTPARIENKSFQKSHPKVHNTKIQIIEPLPNSILLGGNFPIVYKLLYADEEIKEYSVDDETHICISMDDESWNCWLPFVDKIYFSQIVEISSFSRPNFVHIHTFLSLSLIQRVLIQSSQSYSIIKIS